MKPTVDMEAIRTEEDYYHDVAVTVGDVRFKLLTHDVEYSTEVEPAAEMPRRVVTLRLLELPVTFQHWDNAVLRDAKALVAYFERETERLKEAAR